MSGFSDDRDWTQLLHIATDGESYGHHHHFGEMALSYALEHIESNNLAKLTNYGEFLEQHPPTHQVEIFENSSWSCVHGVERWRGNCGCNAGGHGDWNQNWRGPLRNALDWLRDTLAPRFEEKATSFLKDPWAAGNEYIEVILDRTPANMDRFLAKHAHRELSDEEKVTVWKLLELQRHAMLMYTSCGWFFDELSGIETVQVIQYAGRALAVGRQTCLPIGSGSELPWDGWPTAKSNIPEHRTAHVSTKSREASRGGSTQHGGALCDPIDVQEYGDHADIYSYVVDREDYSRAETGKRDWLPAEPGSRRASPTKLRCCLSAYCISAITMSPAVCASTGARKSIRRTREHSMRLSREPKLLKFCICWIAASIRISIRSSRCSGMTRERFVNIILRSTLTQAENTLRQQYAEHAPLMKFLADLHVDQPKLFQILAQFALNSELREALQKDETMTDRVRCLVQEAATMQVDIDTENLEFIVRKQTEQRAYEFWRHPTALPSLEQLQTAVQRAQAMPFKVNLWKVQNLCAQRLDGTLSSMKTQAAQGDESAQAWVNHMGSLADTLGLRVS